MRDVVSEGDKNLEGQGGLGEEKAEACCDCPFIS